MRLYSNKPLTFFKLLISPLHINKLFSFFMIAISIIDGIIPNLSILVFANIIDGTIAVLNKNNGYYPLLLYFIFFLLIKSYQWVIDSIKEQIKKKILIDCRNFYSTFIVDLRSELKYKFIESNANLDLAERVSVEPESKVLNGFLSVLSLVTIFIRLFGIFFIVFSEIWWSAIILVLLTLFTILLSIKQGQSEYQIDREITDVKRYYNYLGEIQTDRRYNSERTIFGYSNYIISMWMKKFIYALKKLQKIKLVFFLKTRLPSVSAIILSIVFTVILLKPTLAGTTSLGLFISLVNSLIILSNFITNSISSVTSDMSNLYEYYKDLKKLTMYDKEEQTGKKDICIPYETIEFINVSFKYPNSTVSVLKNVSFRIEKGIHYAFVGKNGSGKSTIIKLMLGLYDDYNGRILLNGVDIREINKNCLRDVFSIVFQDYSKYEISLFDSIRLGNKNITVEDVKRGIDIADLNDIVNSNNDGLHSILGRTCRNGLDISEGQWQRVAIARGIVKNTPIRIFDEPTASIDPILEGEWYQKIQKISENRTTIFITHRLGSVKFVDEIFVLENGEIIESGSHEKLLAIGGQYAKMFSAQSQWYK